MAFRTRSPEPPPAAPTLEDLQQQMTALQIERTSLGKVLEGLPQREAEALDRDAPDADFAAIDLDRRRTHHRLQRLNVRHVALHDALQAAAMAETKQNWLGFVDRYESITSEMVELGARLTEQRNALVDLVNEGQRAGFSAYSAHGATLPYPEPLYHEVVTQGAAMSVAFLRNWRFGAVAPQLYTVRFLQWTMWGKSQHTTTAYLMGQTAGFLAEDAWELVLAQCAVWVDETNIPPRPPAKKRKIKMPVNGVAEPRPWHKDIHV